MIPIKLVGAVAKSAARPGASPAPQEGISGAAGAALKYLQPGALNLTALPPLSLYIHFPWCVKKCPYCDFNSHEVRGDLPEAEYLAALRLDLESAPAADLGPQDPHHFHRWRHAQPDVGGGPGPADVGRAHPAATGARLRNHHEANPGTFEAEKFKSYRASGINRLSIGIQSFNGRHLQALGRIHDDNEARRAVDIAHANFDNFNLDLMYALPTQTLAEAQQDLETALSFAPPHLSLYHLTLEPNTLFAKYPPVLPDDDASADIADMVAARAAQAGYGRYEVSAYAQPGRQAKHNRNYWEFGDYLGIGAGAHSKISFPHRVLRQARYKQPRAYMDAVLAGKPVQEERELAREEMGFEFMLNTLRLTQGFSPNLFAERTGLAINAIEQPLNAAEAKGLLYRDHQLIRPTERGLCFLNDLQQMFLED